MATLTRNALLNHVAADWPDFADIRRSASAYNHTRLLASVSAATNEVRVALAAAFLVSISEASAPAPALGPDHHANQDTI